MLVRNRTIRLYEAAAAKVAFLVMGGMLLVPCFAQQPVTVNLSLSNENLMLNGLGANSSGLGQYQITLGNCTQTGANTTCTLTGSYTSTSSVLGSGTFTVTTTLENTTTAQLPGVEQSAGSNLFTLAPFSTNYNITLTLVSSTGGTFVEPIVEYNSFVNGASLNFFYASPTCSGTSVPSCSVSSVGATSGSSITGQVTGTATFNLTYTYYFSQMAIQIGYQTTMTYINYSPQTVTCVTNFYADSGSALSVPFSTGAVSTRTDTLGPGESIHAQTTGQLSGSLLQGWAVANCDGPIKGSLLYRYYQSGTPVGEASVLAETAPTTEFATFAQTATGIAYGNPSTTDTATVTVTVFNQAGSKLASKSITLGPLQHGAGNVGPLLNLKSFEGFVEITSNIPIISLSLNAEAFPVFSSLPPGDLPISTPLVQ